MTRQSPAELPVFSKKEFLDWVLQQSGPYVGHACATCAMTQFGKAMLGEECKFSLFELYNYPAPVKFISHLGETLALVEPFSEREMRVVIGCRSFETLREKFDVNS